MIRYRVAESADIPQIQVVRNSVKENVLSDPSKVTDQDCEEYINRRGKGWVCTVNDEVVGFAIADLQDENIWALFVHPAQEARGIGSTLHHLMLEWYFASGKSKAWLTTAPDSRAATFYSKKGWSHTGYSSAGEMKFEMTAENWQCLRSDAGQLA